MQQILGLDRFEIPAHVSSSQMFARRWRLEHLLLWVGWGSAVIWLVLALLFGSSPTMLIAIGLPLGVGNALAWWLLRGPSNWRRLQAVQRVATGATWISAIGAVGVEAGRITILTPGVFLILVTIAGLRYRTRGTVVATAAASLSTTAAFTWHAWRRGDVDYQMAGQYAAAWIALIFLTGIVTGIRSRLSDEGRLERAERWEAERDRYRHELQEVKNACLECRRELMRQEGELARYRFEIERREAQLFEYRRERYQITSREMEVLKLLLTGMIYSRIAGQLSISPDMVKAHVRSIGRKLNTPGGRRAVEQRVRELDLLSLDGQADYF